MVLFSFSHGKAEKGMKRESGESPEQSRCCELYHFALSSTSLSLSVIDGKTDKAGVSQKTCKTLLKKQRCCEDGCCCIVL